MVAEGCEVVGNRLRLLRLLKGGMMNVGMLIAAACGVMLLFGGGADGHDAKPSGQLHPYPAS